MLRRIMSFLVFFFVLLPNLGWPEPERFTVGGKISFPKTGNLYVELVIKQEFESDKPSPFRVILNLTPEAVEKGKTSFTFQDVPQGTYGIQWFRM